MITNCKSSASLQPTNNTDIHSVMGRLFGLAIQEARHHVGLSIEEAARLSGMELSRWLAVEEGYVPQELDQLRAMADALQINFDVMAGWVLTCRAAWENE